MKFLLIDDKSLAARNAAGQLALSFPGSSISSARNSEEIGRDLRRGDVDAVVAGEHVSWAGPQEVVETVRQTAALTPILIVTESESGRGLTVKDTPAFLTAVASIKVKDGLRPALVDLMERAHHARERQQAEERLRLAVEGSGGGVWDLDLAGWEEGQPLPDLIFVSAELKRMIGYEDEEFPNSLKSWQERILPEDKRVIDERVRDHLAGKTHAYKAEYRIRDRKGSIRWLRTCGKILRAESGKPVRWTGIDWDITEEKRRDAMDDSIGRVMGVVTHAARLILKGEKERAFLAAVCRSLIERGKYRLCWIGTAREGGDSSSLSVLAANGAVQGSWQPPETINIKDLPVVEEVMATGVLVLVPNHGTAPTMSNDPFATISSSSALLALPLTSGDRVFGVLCVHSDEANAFGLKEVELLSELRDILVFGIEAIRQRRQVQTAESQLKQSENWLGIAVEASGVGIWDWNLQNESIVFSDTWKSQLGHAPDEVPNTFDEWRSRVHPEECANHFGLLDEYTRDPWPMFEAEVRMRHKDGMWRWILCRATISRDEQGMPLHLIGTHVDITERKRAEEELRRSHQELRSLASHIESIREEERHQLARELHDELGQMLTTIKMDISSIEHRCASSPELQRLTFLTEKVSSVSKMVDGTIRSVRRLAAQMRPSVLDNLGLTAAIQWLCEELQSRSGIVIDITDLKTIDVPPERAIGLYRICQEGLTNSIKHSGATRIKVSLKCHDKLLQLSIVDNGKGITEEQRMRSGSFGLLGIRERALILGGTVTVDGAPGQGTVLKLTVPQPDSGDA